MKIFSLMLLQHFNQTAKLQIAEQSVVTDPSDVEKAEEVAAIKLR